MNEKKILTAAAMFLYTVHIIKMYISTEPLPPFYQLPIMLITGYVFIIVGSFLFFAYIDRQKIKSKKTQDKQLAEQASKTTVSYCTKFNVAGVTYGCALGRRHRQDILYCCSLKDKLYLKEYEYKGKPAYYIVLKKNNLDIGNVPASLVSTIKKYEGYNYDVIFSKIDHFFSEDRDDEIWYAEVKFLVYEN